MKLQIAILTAAAALLHLVAPQAGAVPSWAESFGLDGNTGDDFPLAIAAMPDGGVVVVGHLSYPTNSPANSYLLAIDALIRYAADGTIVWKKALRGDIDNYATDVGNPFARIVTDAQGNIFLASVFKHLDGQGPDITFVAKFNPAGVVVWQKNIGEDTFNSISLAPNGKLVLTSSSGVGGNGGHSYPELTVLDSVTGNAEFILGYDNSNVQYLQALAGSGSMDGTKYLFCTPANGLTVVLVNAAGAVLDTKNYFNFSIGVGARASIPTSDGDFMVLSGDVIRKIGADQVTINGVTTTRLVTRFERRLNYSGMGGDTIVQTADGGYLIGGSISVGESDLPPNTSGAKAGIYKLNGQGDVMRVFAYGGRLNEATFEAEASAGLCSAVPTADGGVAFATDTTSYRNQTTQDDRKPDWWVVKTEALGLIRSFQDVMVDQTARGSSTPYTDNGSQIVVTFDNVRSFSALGTGPALVLSDPVGNLRIQASPPRISSAPTAEAVVSQHFAYQIRTSFFDAGTTITYGATGLPQGFVLDPTTGVISGVAPPGSETTVPILITLNATDGATSVSPFVLGLTIGDGVPVFTVNGNGSPAANLADTVLAFAAKYPGALAGRALNVEASTDNEMSWHPLANGTNGYMTPDPSSGQYVYVVNSTSYPAVNGVYFRAKLSARGHPPDLASNVVGPFSLGSNATRAPQTLLEIKRNGLRADFDFRAILLSSPSGTSVRVQRSTTPSNEGTWTDLQNGNPPGRMIQEEGTDPTRLKLLLDQSPPADGVYFRAVTAVSGSVDTLSNLFGPYTITADTPPIVTIARPSGSGSGSGTAADPIVITVGSTGAVTFTISASATSNRFISSLSILFDGSTISTVTGGATTASQAYTTSFIGHHVIEAVAVDDLGATGRAGTKPLYIQVIPAGATNRNALSIGDAATGSGGNVFAVVTDGGAWNDPTTWIDLHGNNGVPGLEDEAVIGGATVRLPVDVVVKSVFLNTGRVIGPGTLDILGIITVHAGTFENCTLDIFGSNAVCEMVNDTDVQFSGGGFINFGTLNMHGTGGMKGLTRFENHGVCNWQKPLLKASVLAAGLPAGGRAIHSPVQNLGQIYASGLIATGGGNVVSNDSAGLVAAGGGNVVSNDSASLITNDGGTLIAQDGGTLITNDGATVVSENGLGLITNDGGTLITNDGGTSNLRPPNELTATAPSGFIQTGGQTDLNSIQIIGPVTINGGVLTGSGLIGGDLTINGGYLSPGHSAGLIAVTGNYIQGSDGTLIVEAAGGEANQSDQLQIGGSATLGGRLDVRRINGYVPLPNDPFVPLGYTSVTGSFAAVSSNAQLTPTSTGPLVTINPALPNPSTGQPLNVSTRMGVLTNDNVLIAGFIVTGPSGSTKQVLIRGIGPSLAASGVSGTLSDPSLQLNKPDGSTVINDNWQDGDPSAIPPGFAPGDPRESAIVATLTPGAYTAKLSGAHGETGVGLAEVYDLDAASPAKLANISTRGFIDTGDNVMIGGFIIGGTEPARILVRAIGPSLTQFGVAGALSDPTLELHDANGSTISNDDWRNTQEEEIIATTIPPSDNREPAILATLVPGNYTAIVRGKNNTTGVGLVEVYNLQ